MEFTPVPGVSYAHDYIAISRAIAEEKIPEIDTYRTLILEDLWFLVFFGLKMTNANHPFVVNIASEIERGPDTLTLDVWGREHLKSTCITTAETIQAILRNPDERCCIFSYKLDLARAFVKHIKDTLTQSEFLKACFPDVLYADPGKDAPKWSESEGLTVKRKGIYKENTLEASGLIEGMATGKHYTRVIYDDIVTADLVRSPEMMMETKHKFWMSQNLGNDGSKMRVVGTIYHHEDLIVDLMNKMGPDGKKLFHLRLKPSLEPAEFNGSPVFLSQERINVLMANEDTFATQHLCNPSPIKLRKLDYSFVKEVLPGTMPKNLYKFMVIDPAGNEKAQKRGDSWAIGCIGFEPVSEDSGASNLYLLDLILEPMTLDVAIREIVDMYLRNGRILKLGVEKVAQSTAEVHIANALKAKGKHLSIEAENLVILRPGGRSKEERIVNALRWPLVNGTLHVSKGIPNAFRETLKLEMEKFPFWHDDALDMLSYAYDLVKDYKFGKRILVEEKKDPWWKTVRAKGQKNQKDSWIVV